VLMDVRMRERLCPGRHNTTNCRTDADRWRLVLLSRTLPYLRQSELALFDPGDAKCAALLISEQAQPDLNSLVPAALTKPFKIDRLIDLLEGIRLRDASQ
jgi:hypothetical protein